MSEMTERQELVYKDWLLTCYRAAAKSADQSTQIGAMVVDRSQKPYINTISNNGPVLGWKMTDEHWERPFKYSVVEHAERRAIFRAASAGLATGFCTLVSTWAACADCARAIVECGIKTLVRHYPPLDDATERWLESVQIGDRIMKAGGVQIYDVIGDIPGAPSILRGGELFSPSGGILVP